MKNCVFYLPYELKQEATSSPRIRPRKMINAFRECGYDVFAITGFSGERRKLIREFKSAVRAGKTFDFMYSEDSVMPTLLTDPHHYPLHPFMDFGFFKYVKKKLGLKIGLFYRDIYWKFDDYGVGLPLWKKFAALQMYKYDLYQYEKLLDRFYLPSMPIMKYIASEKLESIASELPPGCDELDIPERDYSERDFTKEPLKIFYVGGIGRIYYNFLELASAVSVTENCELTICCRIPDWEIVKEDFEKYMSCGRIKVVHKFGSELEEFYAEADIFSLVFSNESGSGIAKIARPVKSFECLAHELPVLCTKGFLTADFAEENGTGWSVDYNAEAISSTLRYIIAHPDELSRKRQNCKTAKMRNLWRCRAMKVIDDLTS